MPTIIDNILLDDSNIEFNNAAEFIKHTNKLVYLTGKAGTGKTTFLKYLRATTSKNMVVLAPTGVAAINAGGQTIHSFFIIPPSVFLPNDIRLRTTAPPGDIDRSTIFNHFQYNKEKRKLIEELELLVIDEISMVRCDLLDLIDRLLRVFRRLENIPFGGVQVVLIGDTFQLPPVTQGDQWTLLRPFYTSPFFFNSKVIEHNKPIYIELKKIYRQNEIEFIDLLNKIRINNITPEDLRLLNSRYDPNFEPGLDSNYVILATHNNVVNQINHNKLNELPSEIHSFTAEVDGTFPENIMPTDNILNLKVGSQVMFIKNDRNRRYYNGKIAKLIEIQTNSLIIELPNEELITIEREEWNNVRYTWNEKENKIEENIIGSFRQFPIKLAWAITVHKSQGLTFENIIADLDQAFAPGQVYVALSRCTSFNGIVLKSLIPARAISTDSNVLNFALNETPSTLIEAELNLGKANTFYKVARESISELNFEDAYDNILKALKYRNDIGTDEFKKYFITKSKRISSFSSHYNKLFQNFLDLENENNNLKELVVQIENENKEQGENLSELIELNKDLNVENEKLKIQVNDYINKTLSNHKTIIQLNDILNHKQKEIERLKKIKWYQRLFNSD